MLSLLLRVILVVLIVRALWRLLQGVLEGAGYRQVDRPLPPPVKLVRDPVCGMFVTRSRALAAESRGETAYFCSEKCREEWQSR